MTLFSKFSGFDETLADGVEDVLSALVERIKEKDEVKKVGVINANFNIFGKIFYSTRYLQSYVLHSSFQVKLKRRTINVVNLRRNWHGHR